jgi:hypothetical protein
MTKRPKRSLLLGLFLSPYVRDNTSTSCNQPQYQSFAIKLPSSKSIVKIYVDILCKAQKKLTQ